jgi:hypothetical protein
VMPRSLTCCPLPSAASRDVVRLPFCGCCLGCPTFRLWSRHP